MVQSTAAISSPASPLSYVLIGWFVAAALELQHKFIVLVLCLLGPLQLITFQLCVFALAAGHTENRFSSAFFLWACSALKVSKTYYEIPGKWQERQ